MRQIGSWCERVRTQAATQKLVVGLAVLGLLGHVGSVLQHISGSTGWIWS